MPVRPRASELVIQYLPTGKYFSGVIEGNPTFAETIHSTPRYSEEEAVPLLRSFPAEIGVDCIARAVMAKKR